MKIIDFYADFCVPCKQMMPIVEKLGIEKYDALKDEQELAKKYNVRSVPTLIMLNGENEISRLTGYKTETQIRSWIDAEGK